MYDCIYIQLRFEQTPSVALDFSETKTIDWFCFYLIGFSTDSYDADSPSSYRGGNRVELQREGLTLNCPVLHHLTNDQQIVCIAP